jgi:hypothetical protein
MYLENNIYKISNNPFISSNTYKNVCILFDQSVAMIIMPFVLCVFFSGGKAHGPRGPKSYFYMLPTIARVQGLSCALSVKYAQNHLYIVDSLEIPTEDPQVHM